MESNGKKEERMKGFVKGRLIAPHVPRRQNGAFVLDAAHPCNGWG